jgi:hypothetical protein
MAERDDDYENEVVAVAIHMARERGGAPHQFYRYRPEQIMSLIPILRQTGELWDQPLGSKYRRGYVITKETCHAT